MGNVFGKRPDEVILRPNFFIEPHPVVWYVAVSTLR